MRILFEEVVFDLPDIVETDAVGEFDLGECFSIDVVLAQDVLWTRRLHFVKQAEFHLISPLTVISGLLEVRSEFPLW